MKLAPTPEQQQERRWMAQWREAAIALDEVKRNDLANLSNEEAWKSIQDLQSIPDIWRDPNAVCGFIEQQAVFAKARQ